MAKITEDDVREILRLSASGTRNRRLAERYNLSEASICLIVKRKSWTHVQV
jgi:DNA-binding NarL/FixJ family response regulator